jgi:hypothetical protein
MTGAKSDIPCETGDIFAQSPRISHESAVLLSSSKCYLRNFVA